MNWYSKAKKFITEVRSEMAKVSFPSRTEVISTTAVVLIASGIFAVFLWLADLVILNGYQWVVGLLSS